MSEAPVKLKCSKVATLSSTMARLVTSAELEEALRTPSFAVLALLYQWVWIAREFETL